MSFEVIQAFTDRKSENVLSILKQTSINDNHVRFTMNSIGNETSRYRISHIILLTYCFRFSALNDETHQTYV